MQAQDKLKQYKNFILCNTRHDKYLSNRFCINSKYLRENQVFISLEKNTKKNFSNIKDAIEKGASGFITPFIYSRKILNKPVPYLVSKDIFSTYSKLFKYDLLKIKQLPCLIGVTGTNGKTSTSLLLADSLTIQNKKVGLISSEGVGIYPNTLQNDYTTPPIDIIYKNLINFSLKKCDYIIIECSSQGLHQGRLDGIYFDYSVITNIDKDHIDYHKTLRDYIHSKLNIINQSIKVVLNHDCINLKKIDNSQYKCKQKYYISKNPINKKNFIDTDILGSFHKTKMNPFNKYSIKLIIALMKLEKFNIDEILESISRLRPLKGRRHIISTKHNGIFLIDYAHTEQAYKNIFYDFCKNKKVRTLFGCGGDRDTSKRKLTAKIVDKFSSEIIMTEDNSRTEKFSVIKKDIISGIVHKNRVRVIENRKKAIKYLFETSTKNDLNFILGKGNENFILKNNRKIKHNDIDYLEGLISKNGS